MVSVNGWASRVSLLPEAGCTIRGAVMITPAFGLTDVLGLTGLSTFLTSQPKSRARQKTGARRQTCMVFTFRHAAQPHRQKGYRSNRRGPVDLLGRTPPPISDRRHTYRRTIRL